MQAGQLNQRVTVQQPSTTVDALGQRVETWADVFTDWAQALPLRGREFFEAGAMQSEATVRFRLRWRTGVAANMRVVWQGVPHAIVGDIINVGGRHEVLEIMAAAGVRDGQ